MDVDLGEPGERQPSEGHGPEVGVVGRLDDIDPPVAFVERGPDAIEAASDVRPLVEHVADPLRRPGDERVRPLPGTALGVIGGLPALEGIPGHAQHGGGAVPQVADDGEAGPAGECRRREQRVVVEVAQCGDEPTRALG